MDIQMRDIEGNLPLLNKSLYVKKQDFFVRHDLIIDLINEIQALCVKEVQKEYIEMRQRAIERLFQLIADQIMKMAELYFLPSKPDNSVSSKPHISNKDLLSQLINLFSLESYFDSYIDLRNRIVHDPQEIEFQILLQKLPEFLLHAQKFLDSLELAAPCPNCGKIIHFENTPLPATEFICDECHGSSIVFATCPLILGVIGLDKNKRDVYYEIANDCYNEKNGKNSGPEMALELYKKTCGLDHAESCWDVGYQLRRGDGCKKDIENAIGYLQMGIERKWRRCWGELALLYIIDKEDQAEEFKCWDNFFGSPHFGTDKFDGYYSQFFLAKHYQIINEKWPDRIKKLKCVRDELRDYMDYISQLEMAKNEKQATYFRVGLEWIDLYLFNQK